MPVTVQDCDYKTCGVEAVETCRISVIWTEAARKQNEVNDSRLVRVGGGRRGRSEAEWCSGHESEYSDHVVTPARTTTVAGCTVILSFHCI